ncbi:MAG: hypothetical protein WAU88_13195 [Candidatus Zixiibacteriota bacterium]
MIVLDLSEVYIEELLCKQDRAAYLQSQPLLFDHYYRYWSPKGWHAEPLSADSVRELRDRVERHLLDLDILLKQALFDTGRLEVILFVGEGTSNGHAFVDDNRVIVWIPIETYTTDSRARVFLMHELIHGLHYHHSPEFGFRDHRTKNLLGRQLITEGLSTLLTADILGIPHDEALWADYLAPEARGNWMRECAARKAELFQYCRSHFHESDDECALFMANDPNDVMRYRAGYYAGLTVLKDLCATDDCPSSRLLKIGRPALEKLVMWHLGKGVAHHAV